MSIWINSAKIYKRGRAQVALEDSFKALLKTKSKGLTVLQQNFKKKHRICTVTLMT